MWNDLDWIAWFVFHCPVLYGQDSCRQMQIFLPLYLEQGPFLQISRKKLALKIMDRIMSPTVLGIRLPQRLTACYKCCYLFRNVNNCCFCLTLFTASQELLTAEVKSASSSADSDLTVSPSVALPFSSLSLNNAWWTAVAFQWLNGFPLFSFHHWWCSFLHKCVRWSDSNSISVNTSY